MGIPSLHFIAFHAQAPNRENVFILRHESWKNGEFCPHRRPSAAVTSSSLCSPSCRTVSILWHRNNDFVTYNRRRRRATSVVLHMRSFYIACEGGQSERRSVKWHGMDAAANTVQRVHNWQFIFESSGERRHAATQVSLECCSGETTIEREETEGEIARNKLMNTRKKSDCSSVVKWLAKCVHSSIKVHKGKLKFFWHFHSALMCWLDLTNDWIDHRTSISFSSLSTPQHTLRPP